MSNLHERFSHFPFDKLSDAYMSEINGLSYATTLPEFQNILDHLINYQKFIQQRKRDPSTLKMILNASNGTRIINSTSTSASLREIIYTAHVAACCDMLKGSQLLFQQLQPEPLKTIARNFLSQKTGMSEQENLYSVQNLHSMDAVRTILLLRLLGLITRQSEKMYQLALGTGSGIKDMYSIHRLPQISTRETNRQKTLAFNVIQKNVAEITLVDADPMYHDYYIELEKEDNLTVTTYNYDTIEALKAYSNEITNKRNLITLIRIDHRMIPDVDDLLCQLIPLISDECDFILSIGSGDTLEDFEGRTNKVQEIFDTLESANLKPVLFKMHKPGALQNQWATLHFGHPGIASYQILYCALNKKALKKYYA